MDIEDSQSVTLQGFTINGGFDGVVCSAASVCYLTANTVQSSVGQEAVAVVYGARAFLASNSIQNNTQRGLTVASGLQVFSGSDTFQGNRDAAIVANSGFISLLLARLCRTMEVMGAMRLSPAIIRLSGLSHARSPATPGSGVRLQHSAEARFDNYAGPTTVTGMAVAASAWAIFPLPCLDQALLPGTSAART